MPVRLLTQSLLKWPEPAVVLEAVRFWAAEQSQQRPGFERLGVYGSYGRGDAGVGSDLDLVLIDSRAAGTAADRFRQWPFEMLPLCCDALILTPLEWERLVRPSSDGSAQNPAHDPAKATMAMVLQRDCRWLWMRSGGSPSTLHAFFAASLG